MDILIIMGIGIFIGLKFFPDKYKKKNEKMQMVCTILIIFSMGVMLGRRENFLQEITSLGLTSFLYFFSILIVYLLTRLFMKNKSKEKEG